MKRMIVYCEKMNWFEEQLQRRLNFKRPKVEPSKEEIKAREIIRLQENIIRYEKKILYWQKKLRKATKSYNLRKSYYVRKNPQVMVLVGNMKGEGK